MTEASSFFFDGWTLRVASGELIRDGKTQRLTQQPLRILIELLTHPGEVVTRERLVELLWPKGIVDFDNGLNVAMRKVRIALGDDTDTPRYIETLPRLGYRFIGRLEPAGPSVTTAPPLSTALPSGPETVAFPVPRYRWLIATGALVLVTAASVGAWRLFGPAPAATSAPPGAPLVARRTTSVRAYEHYLQAIFHRSRRDADGTALSIQHFEAAIAEDPEYAEAWAGLADTYVGAAIGHHLRATEAHERGLAAANRAVALDPGLAESRTALGQIYMFFERDYAAAEAEYARAREANDRYARMWHHLGTLRAFQGRADEALAAMRRARELEPMTLLYNANYGLVLYQARRYDEAIAHVRGLLASQPALDQSRSVLIRSLVAKGDIEGARAQLPLRRRESPNLSDAGLVYAHAGEFDRVHQEIAKIDELRTEGLAVGYELAVLRAALADTAGGCAALEFAWHDRSPFLGWIRLDPRLDALRGEPCFREIEARVGSPAASR